MSTCGSGSQIELPVEHCWLLDLATETSLANSGLFKGLKSKAAHLNTAKVSTEDTFIER